MHGPIKELRTNVYITGMTPVEPPFDKLAKNTKNTIADPSLKSASLRLFYYDLPLHQNIELWTRT